MNNPIDGASVPLMELSFAFAVYQREKGFCLISSVPYENKELPCSGFVLLGLALLEEHSSYFIVSADTYRGAETCCL